MIRTHIEIEEIETPMKELDSLLLMLETAMNSDLYDARVYCAGVEHLTFMASDIVEKLEKLKKKYIEMSKAEKKEKEI